jgi:O-antigen/teichoic acid export membrane protein
MASGGSLMIASASQLVMFAVLARSLGVDDFSVFVSVTAFTAVAVQLCGLGAMDSLVRRVARDRSMYPVMLGHNLLLTFSTGGILLLVGLLSIPFLFPLSPDPLINFGACALMILANVLILRLIMMTEQVFIAHSDFRRANGVVIVSGITRAAAAILACMVFNATDLAQWAVWHFAANGSVALLCFYWMQHLGAPVYRIVREEVPLGFYFSTQFIFRSVRQNADLMMLSIVTSAEVVSSYAVARRILDSSYISIDAFYRLAYPGSAVATAHGLHYGLARVRQMLLLTLAISVPTVVAIFAMAPLLPLLFGDKYVSLVFFVQAMCWAGIILALYSAALEMLSASGHQGARAAIFNTANVLGSGLVVVAAYVAAVPGTVVASYLIEIATAIAAWVVMGRLMESSRNRTAVAV